MRKILVANRGEIARRVFRTCKEMGIAGVAVYSEPDRDAPFVAEADEAVPLGGAAPSESYLASEKIVAAAMRVGADAIHPGYGFLAENAEFAARCRAAGLVFIGPPPDAIAAMGSKIEAKRRMEAAGVPVIRSVEVQDLGPEALMTAAETLGFPVLVKASAGGGGRGMRIVRSATELVEAVAGAQREALSAFGDGTVFLEGYLEGARHVEFQVFADTHGSVVHLFERECSIQRRHQKIIEECPCPVLEEDEGLRSSMGKAAVAAAQAIGYVGAGTVEFLLTPEGQFFFLEMNTRLQVEHPVTECVTGLDLVRLQILVAQGDPLPPEARAPVRRGHAIEARLYAEDPQRDFLPTTGRIHRFSIPERPGLRVDSAVEDGSVVGVHYDPLLAKVISHAPSRSEAAQRLAAALAGMRLHGLVTNRDLLVRVLRHPEFEAGKTDTGFLERHDPRRLGAPLADDEALRLHAVAAALSGAARHRRSAIALRFAPSGWRNNPSQLQEAAFETPSGRVEVGYRFGRDGLALRVNGGEIGPVCVYECGPDAVDLEMGGVRRRFEVQCVGEIVYVDSALGSSALKEALRFPSVEKATDAGSLHSPMPGVVVRIGARPGEVVLAGDIVAVVEAMKMEHSVRAPHPGRVTEIRVKEGETVEAGFVLAVIEEG